MLMKETRDSITRNKTVGERSLRNKYRAEVSLFMVSRKDNSKFCNKYSGAGGEAN